MDRENLFMEDTDFNVCLSWLCDSTDGQTYSISNHFGKKMKMPEGMGKAEWFEKTMNFLIWQVWEDAIGWKHDYKVDDPAAKAEAERMVRDLNALINRLNADPDYLHWDDDGVYVMECRKDGEEYFSFKYRGEKSIASRFCADLVISEMGDGDGENGGKGSLRDCVKEIAEAFYSCGGYCYADCVFTLRKEQHRQKE